MAKPQFILQIDFSYCHCIYTSNVLWSGPRTKGRLSLYSAVLSGALPGGHSMHNSAHSADSCGWNGASRECLCGEEQVLQFSYTWIETVNWMHLPCSHSKFIQHSVMLFIPLTKYAYLLLHTGSGTVYQLRSFLLFYKLFYPKFYILLQNSLEFNS